MRIYESPCIYGKGDTVIGRNQNKNPPKILASSGSNNKDKRVSSIDLLCMYKYFIYSSSLLLTRRLAESEVGDSK